METRRDGLGHVTGSVAGAGLIASLWLPWYSFTIPPAAINDAVQVAHQYGLSPSLISLGADYLNHLGPLHFTAWNVMTTIPAIVLVCGVLGGGLAVLSLTGRATEVGRAIGGAGLVATCLVGFRVLVLPGQGGFLQHAWGVYLALVAAIAMTVGGALASGEHAGASSDLVLDLSAPAAPATTWSPSGSVPPPSH